MSRPPNDITQQGFAVIVVLGLLAVAGLLALSALHDAAFGQALAGARQHRQQAFAAAELGMRAALHALATADPRPDATGDAPAWPGTRATFRWRRIAVEPLPRGFSSDQVARHHYEVESEASAPRRAIASQMAGVTRLVPLPAPAVP